MGVPGAFSCGFDLFLPILTLTRNQLLSENCRLSAFRKATFKKCRFAELFDQFPIRRQVKADLGIRTLGNPFEDWGAATFGTRTRKHDGYIGVYACSECTPLTLVFKGNIFCFHLGFEGKPKETNIFCFQLGFEGKPKGDQYILLSAWF